jgi:hypothetical protein
MGHTGATPRIFISYSHADEAWKDRVVSQLGVLEHEGLLSVWEDRQIAAGDAWLPAIETAINSCNVALLLISAKFLTSKFILGNEVPALLQRREQEGVRVIPVILESCAWTRVSWLKTIQARPKDGKPLRGMTKHKASTALAALTEEVADLLARSTPTPKPDRPHVISPDKIDLTKLPAGAADFLGRVAELKLLDDAWADGGYTQVVELVAPGGVGKTALVKRWLDRLKAEGWRGAQRVYGWSFFSQGTSDDRQASDDNFLSAAFGWFAVKHDPALSPWDKGKLLAEAVIASRILLVLDGVEPLQYPPGPMAGQLRAPGLKAMLTQLVSSGQPGLCLLTTRERIQDLEEYERCVDYSTGAVIRHDLGNLSEADGARLLHRLGVRHASAAAITLDDAELQKASGEVHGHALTLSLLGSYLAQAHEGDIRQRDKVEFDQADNETRGGYAFKVMAAYEQWLQREGEQGARELAALRLLGYFDRPADAGCLAALRRAPPISGLTESLVDLNTAQWNIILSRLKTGGLIELTQANPPAIDAHPLVREYLAKALRERQPDAWREGHRRLYEHLKASVPYRPDGLAGLQPLYQAVVHGCLAGLPQQAYEEVYISRILRGTERDGFYSTKKLGAFGADLGAVACFFEEPWQRVSPALSAADQAWLLNQAAFRLRALGRPSEALEPMRAATDWATENEGWLHAAVGASNLSGLKLTLGRVAAAVQDGEQSVAFADRSGDAFLRMVTRTTLADALHQQGQREPALARFREAEVMQAEDQPHYLLLYSLRGFQYCDLLLAQAERAAWQRQLASSPWQVEGRGEEIDTCHAVEQRAAQTLKWAEQHLGLSDVALDHLTLGRAALLRAVLDNSAIQTPQSALAQAIEKLNATVDGLRAAGQQDDMPRGLLSRAWLHTLTNNPTAAHADLDEAWQIATRGDMRLFMADIRLHRARLFRDKAELHKAHELIEQYGYWRRKEELEDAETAARGW